MSKSFDVSVNFNFRVVFTDAQIKEALEAVGAAKLYVASGKTNDPQRLGVCKAVLAAAEKGEEALLLTFLKDSMKQIRELVIEETRGDDNMFKNFSPFYATYKARENRGPKVCNRCEVTQKVSGRKCELCRSMEVTE